MTNVFGMEGKTALVTGARQGIGLATARALLALGARVALLDVDRDGVRAAAGSLGVVEGTVLALKADVTERSEVEAAVAEVLQSWGQIDALVNSAGVHETKPILKLTAAQFERMLRVNVLGTFYCTQAVLPAMIERRRGAIICLASLAARRGQARGGGAHYAASKGAVVSFARSVAREVGAHGIRVNCVAPGLVATPMSAGFDEEYLEATKKLTPLARIAQPEDIADPIAFLCSDASRHITGQVLNICGGQWMS